MLSSICFMPASLTPQSLPPGSPTMSMYLSGSTVVMCIRAGLYQTKNGLLVFFGSLRSRKSIDLGRDLLVHRLRPLQRQRALVLAGLVRRRCRRRTVHQITGRGGVRQIVVFGSTAPGTSGRPGIGVFLQGGATVCSVGRLVDVGEAHPLHRVQMVEIAPELLEAVRGRQRVGVVAQMVLAELAGGVAEVVQELGERRRAGPQVATGCPAAAAGSCRCAAGACR